MPNSSVEEGQRSSSARSGMDEAGVKVATDFDPADLATARCFCAHELEVFLPKPPRKKPSEPCASRRSLDEADEEVREAKIARARFDIFERGTRELSAAGWWAAGWPEDELKRQTHASEGGS